MASSGDRRLVGAVGVVGSMGSIDSVDLLQDLQALCKPLGFSLLTAELNELKDRPMQGTQKGWRCDVLAWQNVVAYLMDPLFGSSWNIGIS